MSTQIPEWLNAELFISVLEKNVNNFEKIQSFCAKPAFAAGENYLSILWSIEIEVLLKNDSAQTLKYMLKVPPTSDMALAITSMLNSFDREKTCYYELFPIFEDLYRKAGKNVQFAPKVFKFENDLGFDVILMEDLRMENYKNMNRLEGLDMAHTESALRKLAEFHAASATYLAEKGVLPEALAKPLVTEQTVSLLKTTQKPQDQKLLENLEVYKATDLKEKLINYPPLYFQQLLVKQKPDTSAFNVLSHGDCWSNNIMFQHDKEGKIQNTRFVDFQTGRQTSPALDLTYFLLSSTCLDNKVKYFDYFVQYYHKRLEKNLRTLNYPKNIPRLRDIHKWLYDFSCIAYTVILKTLPVVLLDPTAVADITMDNMMGDKSDGGAMERKMYTNERYCRHMQLLLPWLANRGYFE